MRANAFWWLIFPLGAMVPALACGDNGSPATDAEMRRVAREFAIALVEDRDSRAALEYAPGLETDVELAVAQYKRDKMHIVGGPFRGCRQEDIFQMSEPCYRFRLRGEPVPDPGNPGFATVAYGWEFVSMTGRDPPTVQAIGFTGGARGVKDPKAGVRKS